ncbi:centrosomal protein of 131 kDa isoform X2 [Salarias fasciatus]|uniref:centrosomal protein of 131 kDa isoform X2 n=1 Tax=Salarias fasciatus TaxID=181472 RepID=UPI001176EB96|nr:centrosomal protein of 131 kDa isoform X2 [Salarias fasciatus]
MQRTGVLASVPSGVPGDALHLSLSGTRLSMSRRPDSASPGKSFSRSGSGGSRAPRPTPTDVGLGSCRSIKNLRRCNSTTQVNQQPTLSTRPAWERDQDYLSLFDSSSDGRRKLASLGRTSGDGSTWNVLDDQPRALAPPSSTCSSAGVVEAPSSSRTEAGCNLTDSYTANNRSSKGGVGNSVTTIFQNNHSDKPLTPKSSNQKPSFNNLLKATAADGLPPDTGSLTKSQKNFSAWSGSSGSARAPAPARRSEVTEEEAERFIQQVNRAAVTIQRWYRRRAGRATLRRFLDRTRKELEERTVEDGRPEEPHKKDRDRKRIREEKARLARLAAVQELQQQRAQRAAQHSGVGSRTKPPRTSPTTQGPAPPSNSGPRTSPIDFRTRRTDSNVSAERSFRAVSPAQRSQQEGGAEEEEDPGQQLQRLDSHREAIRKESAHVNTAEELQGAVEAKRENPPPATGVTPNKAIKIIPGSKNAASASNKRCVSPCDMKTRNSDSNLDIIPDVAELSFRGVYPEASNRRGSQCSKRSVSVEEQRRGASSKTVLNELLDTLKLLEEEPEQLAESQSRRKDKYAWIDEDVDSSSLTTDNLERHGQLSRHPAPPGGGALLSEAKLQSIMSFLDEMEESEQERPGSASGSHREAALSEEEVTGVEQASAAGSMMRVKLELEEKKRTVDLLQAALAQQRELTVRHVKEAERELSRGFQLQKDQYEATIQRHLTFIDQLIGDKKALSERCEGVLGELKQVDHKYMKKMAQMQEQHEMVWQILSPLCEEIKKLKDLMSATEKIRREKWIDEKTKKIKAITVKGLEPEIQKLISKHKQELKKLQTLHEAELLQADERAARRYVRQAEELRQQLEREKQQQCQRDRELAKQRYEKELQEEELSLQQQRRRLYKDVSQEKDRLAQLASRQRAELDELRRQLEENSAVAGRALRDELDRSREEQDRRHQVEMKALQERLELEKQTWEENSRKKEEAWLLSRERELRDQLRRERDKEIELAIWTLEEETSKDKEECERAADSRLKRLREKYEAELRELERSERTAVEKHQQLRKQQMETEAELIRLQATLRLTEQQVEDVTQARDKLADERRGLAQVIRQEFADRLVTTEEENRRLKVEVSEVRARLRLEAERLTQEKEEELAEVHQRVKSAILKKEEIVCALRKQHQAAVKRADHLEALWEQQRKQLLEK